MLVYLSITAAALVLAAAYDRLAGEGSPAGRRGFQTKGEAARVPVLLLLVLFLTVPLVLRQATGNDYMKYVEFFHLAYSHAYVPTEAGFNVLARLVYGLCGYENYLLLFGIYGVLTCVFFVWGILRECGEAGGKFLPCFALFLMFGYYFQSYNTVRYYFALSISLFALHDLLERRPLRFVLLILFAALFHKSVLVVLVLYPAALIRWRKGPAAAALLLAFSALFFQDFWMRVIIRLYPSYLDTEILDAGGRLSVFNVIKCLAVFGIAAVSLGGRGRLREAMGERRFRFYAQASVLALAIYCFGYFVPEVSRIAYYLMITQIFWIPDLIRRCPEKRRRPLTVFTVLFALGCFAAFWYRAGDIEIRILPYKSFLFHDLPETPSRSIR